MMAPMGSLEIMAKTANTGKSLVTTDKMELMEYKEKTE
jgi:hypothetical protein